MWFELGKVNKYSCKPGVIGTVSATQCILINVGLVPLCPCVAFVGWIISALHAANDCICVMWPYCSLISWNFALDWWLSSKEKTLHYEQMTLDHSRHQVCAGWGTMPSIWGVRTFFCPWFLHVYTETNNSISVNTQIKALVWLKHFHGMQYLDFLLLCFLLVYDTCLPPSNLFFLFSTFALL